LARNLDKLGPAVRLSQSTPPPSDPGCGGKAPAQASTLVFLDPPYDAAQEYASTLTLLGAGGALRRGALVVAEHPAQGAARRPLRQPRTHPAAEQGDASLSFYAVPAESRRGMKKF